MTDKQIILTLIVLLLLANHAGAVKVIPKSEDKWTCYDYSVNFAKENPEWGIVTMSDNQLFRSSTGYSHTVNYKVISNDTLLIHDGLHKTDYLLAGWKIQGFITSG